MNDVSLFVKFKWSDGKLQTLYEVKDKEWVVINESEMTLEEFRGHFPLAQSNKEKKI